MLFVVVVGTDRYIRCCDTLHLRTFVTHIPLRIRDFHALRRCRFHARSLPDYRATFTLRSTLRYRFVATLGAARCRFCGLLRSHGFPCYRTFPFAGWLLISHAHAFCTFSRLRFTPSRSHRVTDCRLFVYARCVPSPRDFCSLCWISLVPYGCCLFTFVYVTLFTLFCRYRLRLLPLFCLRCAGAFSFCAPHVSLRFTLRFPFRYLPHFTRSTLLPRLRYDLRYTFRWVRVAPLR